jgi:elongation factor P
VRTKLKNVLSGKVVDKTFNAGTKVETATVDKRTMQYLYMDGDDFVFMDWTPSTRSPCPAPPSATPPTSCSPRPRPRSPQHEGVPLYIELPTSVFLEVTYTEPGLQGDRSTGGTKPATVETGATVNVPLFITTGEKIKVDTRFQGPEALAAPGRGVSSTRAKRRRARSDTAAGPPAFPYP